MQKEQKIKIPNLAQIIKWSILAAVLVLLINYIIQHSHEFGFLKEIRIEYIIPIILLSIFALLLSCYRFNMMLTHVSHRIPHYTVFKYFVFGRFMNKFIPLGGSVYRAIMFKKTDGMSYKKFIAISASFDWLNLVTSSLLGIVIVGVYDPHLKIRSISLLPFLLGALILLIMGIPAAKKVLALIHRSVSAGSFRKRMSETAEIIDRVIDVLRNWPIFFGNGILISLIIGSNLISFHLLFKSIGVDTDIVVLLVYLIILRFFKALRITPANLGIREFLLGFLSYSMGTGAAEGVAVSVIMRLITLLVQSGMSFGIFATEGTYRFIKRAKNPE